MRTPRPFLMARVMVACGWGKAKRRKRQLDASFARTSFVFSRRRRLTKLSSARTISAAPGKEGEEGRISKRAVHRSRSLASKKKKLTLRNVRSVLSHGETDIGSFESRAIVHTISGHDGRAALRKWKRKVRSRRVRAETSFEKKETNHSLDVPSVDGLDHSDLGLGS